MVSSTILEKKGRVKDFIDAFPNLKLKDISNILQELKNDQKIKFVGNKKIGYWELSMGVNKSENITSSDKK